MARRSTIPMKEKIYLIGFFTIQTLKKYSIVNNTVKIHSNICNNNPYLFLMSITLSNETQMTDRTMVINRTTSNNFPFDLRFKNYMK